MNFDKCELQGLTYEMAKEISLWEYEKPYDVYNFKGTPNGYLLKEDTWGKEQFCLLNNGIIVGQVACQFDGDDLWVGWSLSPTYCGQGNGSIFIEKCIENIRKTLDYKGAIYLKVAAWNERAKRTYLRAGFIYVETVKDEIAYTNNIQDFWVMKNNNPPLKTSL